MFYASSLRIQGAGIRGQHSRKGKKKTIVCVCVYDETTLSVSKAGRNSLLHRDERRMKGIDCDLNQVAHSPSNAQVRETRLRNAWLCVCVMAFVILVINANVRIQRGKKKAPASVKRK